MKTNNTKLFQSKLVKGMGTLYATRGNGNFGNVVRTGWEECKLGDKKKQIILNALQDSDVDKVYKRFNKIYAFYLNGTEKQIA